MHHYSARDANMNKENVMNAKSERWNVAITRARAKALGTAGGLPPQYPSAKLDQNKAALPNLKRLSDENKPSACIQSKKRAAPKDVTNVFSESSCVNSSNGGKDQPIQQRKSGVMKRNTKLAPLVDPPQVQVVTKTNITEDKTEGRMEESQEISSTLPVNVEGTSEIRPNNEETSEIQPRKSISTEENVAADVVTVIQTSSMYPQPGNPSEKEGQVCKKEETLKVADIDSNQKDPQMCGMYAPDIYVNLRVTELDRRPSVDYMEMLQRDINHGMRGILIDWLVEVSDEYRMVPDTLYLTVNLIDRFLSKTYIEKQSLQLLGITCMLIASKYEEICAPRVEEFCFITDNTYKRNQVLGMESQVLNFLEFRLSVPTTKKFLRRFIHAAQSSYEVPCVELEFLTNYLAELTLTEYSFLKFLPSLIAASAVFLARWTLDQSNHPWNPTLEHYTRYTATELRSSVLELQELQLNTNGSSLNAIRAKYRQQKFKYVATLSSSKPVQTIF